MEHQRIDPAARVWIIFRGPDGKLRDELDPLRLESITENGEIANEHVEAAGEPIPPLAVVKSTASGAPMP